MLPDDHRYYTRIGTILCLIPLALVVGLFLYDRADRPNLMSRREVKETKEMAWASIIEQGRAVGGRKAGSTTTRTLSPQAGELLLPPEAESLARTLNAPDGTGEQDVQTLSSLVELFRRANQGAIPAGGLNEEITEQLLGKNPQHFAVLPPDCPGLDGAGRLLDRWGRPYFLHPLSREVLEIRSVGPDGKFGNDDDLVAGDEAGREVRR